MLLALQDNFGDGYAKRVLKVDLQKQNVNVNHPSAFGKRNRGLTFAVNICHGDDCIEQVSPASEEKSMAPNA